MIKVLLESPFAGDIDTNLRFARRCMRDCFMRGEFPFASHLLYTQDGVLNDAIKEERDLGILAGLKWGEHAEKTVVYTDLGISEGMKHGIKTAKEMDREVEYRTLDCNHSVAYHFNENSPRFCPNCKLYIE